MAANNGALRADARPTKGFFIRNLTRDLSLEDAILDLVDNSIDAFIRTRNLNASPELLSATNGEPPQVAIKILFNEKEFRIEDTCGGMDLEHAKSQVFRFGRPDGSYESSLGVYGIGLKRALFKIGRQIEVTSQTTDSGFRVAFDVAEWARSDKDWTLPLERSKPAKRFSEAGTQITIRELTPEVSLRLEDGTLFKRLSSSMSSTYALFLSHHLGIELNGVRVRPVPLPLAVTDLLKPNAKTIAFDGVQVSLIAGLQERRQDEWNAERAGWYVLCNGRVVVNADKTDLTGWGISGPTFVSQYRGFLGIAFFFSTEPEDLPWTTTKRGLNRDSPAFQMARKEMTALARPVLSFLRSFYPTEADAEKPSRELVADLKPAKLGEVVAGSEQTFPSTVPHKSGRKATVRVQFDAERVHIERIKRKIGKPFWSAGAVGRFTFEHYLETELPE